MAAKPKNAKPEPAAEVAKLTLTAVEPIRIDGIDIAPGEPFEATAEDAEALRITGAATLAAAE